MRLDLPKEVRLTLVDDPEETASRPRGLGKKDEENPERLYQKIQKMTVAEKIKLATLGNKEARAILLREANKQILLAVIHSPKITESEVEAISSSRSMPEEVLREIAKQKDWIRNKRIVSNLVKNPKTPLDISLHFLPRLDTRELRELARSKNIPTALRTAVIRLLEQRTQQRKR
ncbi:MAG: hypothetical protein D6736_11890 [Nitrospinota bacterium]|nr:MAG: hypothetical protein D6736_11890 [Nitrospinota bacterium]